jgi:membrane protein
MPHRHPAREILKKPWAFVVRVAEAFQANQGLLLAGALAYYTLLSFVPLFTLLLLMLSHVVDEGALLSTLTLYIGLAIPGNSDAILAQITNFLHHREVAGWVVLGGMLFFSSLAFTVLENAMSIIFVHRVRIRRRTFLVSALLPYFYILLLGAGFLVVTLIASVLQTLGQNDVVIFGRDLPLGPLSIVLLYLIGVGGQILILTAIYLVMPTGHLSLRHALIGGVVAGLLWEITRHVLVWYFAKLSMVGVVYGSLATTIVGLLSLEIASIILLLGAQVIAEYERFAEQGILDEPPAEMRYPAEFIIPIFAERAGERC